MHYKISICIPTYNRAACLQVLLDSIFSEKTPVEICISNNASTDNTEKLVREYQNKYHNIVYFRSDNNVGFDRNCLQVVSLAHAEYCWLMGDDDRIKEGAIDYILNILSANHGFSGISLNVDFYNKLLTQKKHYTLHFDSNQSNQNKTLTSAGEILPFLIDHFGFISAQIIKRNLWEEIINNNVTRNFLNSYVHLFVITGVVNAHPYWLWVARPCVDRRVTTSNIANDSYRQLETMVTAYYQTISHFFPIHGWMHNKIMESLYKTNIKYSVRSLASSKEKDFTKKAISLLLKYNCWRYPAFWFYTFPWVIMPGKILYLFHYIQKKLFIKQL